MASVYKLRKSERIVLALVSLLDGLVDLGPAVGCCLTLLLSIKDDPGDVLLLGLFVDLRQSQSSHQYLLLQPLRKSRFGSHIDDGGHRGYKIQFACVTERCRTLRALC